MNEKVTHSPTVKFLTLSQRIARCMISAVLITIILTETTLATLWLVVFSALAIYTLLSGLFGWDPLLRLLKHANTALPDHRLTLAAQLECLVIGLLCVAVGILNSGSESLLLNMLPFLGIYPILLCAIKYDVLAYLVQTYRKAVSMAGKE